MRVPRAQDSTTWLPDFMKLAITPLKMVAQSASLLLLFLPAALSQTPCSSTQELLAQFAPGELGFSSYTENPSNVHLTCYAVGGLSGTNLSIVQQTTTEFQRGQVGIRSDQPDEDASYPCGESQDSWGQLNLEVREVNGVDIHGQGDATITTNTPTCSFGTDRAFFDSSFHITQVVTSDLTIDGYMFRNAAAQAAANLQHTMTIGTLDACKLELIYALRPKTGGGLDMRVTVQLAAFGGNGGLTAGAMENRVNSAVSAEIKSADNKMSVYVPKQRLLEGSGRGPNGCGSTFSSESGSGEAGSVNHHLVDVSLSFTCGSTGESTPGTIQYEYLDMATLTITLSSTQAPESCGVMYWDPLITPISGDGVGAVPLDGDNRRTIILATAIPGGLLVLLVALVSWKVCKKKRRRKANVPITEAEQAKV